MTHHDLPPNPSLENLKKQAKSLLKQLTAGELAAAQRVVAAHPKFQNTAKSSFSHEGLQLSDCQLVLSRELGFPSWPALKTALDSQTATHVTRFLRSANLSYIDHRAFDLTKARNLLADQPKLIETSIWAAATAGNKQLVERLLDEDQQLVNQAGGPNRWSPLQYLCHSRIESPESVATAVELLRRGADPNVSYVIGENCQFTCITAAIGEGEAGTQLYPPHPQAEQLVAVLLDHGANPNDSQGLYNSMFTGGTHWIQLLLNYGLRDQCINWAPESEMRTVDYFLAQACKYGHADRAELLLRHGADPDTHDWYENKPCYAHAMGRGNVEIAHLLVRHGGTPVQPASAKEQFFIHCMAADRQAVESLIQQHPADEVALWRADDRKMSLAVEANQIDGVRMMLDYGVEIGYALFEAAWNGRLDMAQLLIERGASARLRHDEHDVTPIAFANRAGHVHVREYLLAQDIDIFDAIRFDRPDRISELSKLDPEALERTLSKYLNGDSRSELGDHTPLGFAVVHGKVEAVKLLLEHGANRDVYIGDRSIHQIAADLGNREIIELVE